jgi:uncharacterized Zn finger protein
MSVDELMEKAERLVRSRRVTPLEDDRYNVVGDHGTYLVSVLLDGKVTCNCPGFGRKNMCSHVMAVILLRKRLGR